MINRMGRPIELRAGNAVAEAESRLWPALEDIRHEAREADARHDADARHEAREAIADLGVESLGARLDALQDQLGALSGQTELRNHQRDAELEAIRRAFTDAIVEIASQQGSLSALLERFDRRLARAELPGVRPAPALAGASSYEVVSYAQNQEDVVLARMTNLVAHGTFVDVGAGHPIMENVTYALYLRGWRGVNIEPMSREVEMYGIDRPDDETLQLAIGAEKGSLTLYEAPLENRGATTSDVNLVEKYSRDGEDFVPFEVAMVTLSSVFAQYAPGDVHVVKIDVEGMETDVLVGADLPKHQPWVLVIEATQPNSSADASQDWEPLVLNSGYRLVLFDGLNRFYVREDLTEIAELLSLPANVFDHWVSYQLVDKERALEAAMAFAAAMDYQRSEAEGYARSLETVLAAQEPTGITSEST